MRFSPNAGCDEEHFDVSGILETWKCEGSASMNAICPANQHWVRRTSSKREIFQSTAGEEVVNQYISR
jgi:hypothetical protein